MLVDDDAAVIGTNQAMLTRLDYQVSAWTEPERALSEFTAHDPSSRSWSVI